MGLGEEEEEKIIYAFCDKRNRKMAKKEIRKR